MVKTVRSDNGFVGFDGGSIWPLWWRAGSSAPEHTLDKREVGRFKSSPAHHFSAESVSGRGAATWVRRPRYEDLCGRGRNPLRIGVASRTWVGEPILPTALS